MNASPATPYAVLVAGEHHTVLNKTGLGGHASINSVATCFSLLRRYLPRDRIIVIAQLQECWDWHQQDVEDKVKDIEDPARKVGV